MKDAGLVGAVGDKFIGRQGQFCAGQGRVNPNLRDGRPRKRYPLRDGWRAAAATERCNQEGVEENADPFHGCLLYGCPVGAVLGLSNCQRSDPPPVQGTHSSELPGL